MVGTRKRTVRDEPGQVGTGRTTPGPHITVFVIASISIAHSRYPGAVLECRLILLYVQGFSESSQQPYDSGTSITPSLQMRKPRQQEVTVTRFIRGRNGT